ncbi:MAG TPA: hypothetical protein VNA25_03080 [Phycisphaerae bacterium]|nr:hypothetical protein [Phycisphaerae bacterium]
MTIRWANVIAVALAILALVVGLRERHRIAELFSAFTDIGSHPSPEERTWALAALGLVLVSLVAVVKILSTSRSKP